MNLHRDLQLQNALNVAKQFLHSLNGRVSEAVWKDSYDALQEIEKGFEALAVGDQIERTNFTAMGRLNEIAGNGMNGGWPAITHQIKLIESEFNELKDGIEARDIHEVRDGIQDILVTTYGLAWRAGFPADLDAAEVVRSNMSKFDTTIDDARLTTQKYLAIGVKTYQLKVTDEGDDSIVYYITRSAEDQKGTDGKSYPMNKWLKSHRFEEPKYCPLHPLVAAELARK